MNTVRAYSAGATVIHIQDAPAPHTQYAPITHIQADAPTAVLELDEEVQPPIQERMRKTAGKLDYDLSVMKDRIHRFPESLRGIGGQDDRYIQPSVVAIGPYHRRLSRVQKMEDVKHAVAVYLCRRLGYSPEEIYDSVLSVVGSARGCYADEAAVVDLSDAEFAEMMFLDGCFLLQFMDGAQVPPFLTCDLVSRHCILRDMMLLENQIPWIVFEALRKFTRALDLLDLHGYVARVGGMLLPDEQKKRGPFRFIRSRNRTDETERSSEGKYRDYKPAHLLDLLLCSQTYRISKVGNSAYNWSPQSRSAVELARMGIHLNASKKAWLGHMGFISNPVFGELSLSRVFLNEFTACWLVNLAALEAIVDVRDWPSNGFVVSSYLSVLAMLMDREEDVQRLRVKSLLRGTFSDTQVLGFFNSLTKHLSFGGGYFRIMEDIQDYRDNRPVRIFVHRRLYKGYKALTIATLGSIAGMLVGIFKTLLSKKLAA